MVFNLSTFRVTFPHELGHHKTLSSLQSILEYMLRFHTPFMQGTGQTCRPCLNSPCLYCRSPPWPFSRFSLPSLLMSFGPLLPSLSTNPRSFVVLRHYALSPCCTLCLELSPSHIHSASFSSSKSHLKIRLWHSGTDLIKSKRIQLQSFPFTLVSTLLPTLCFPISTLKTVPFLEYRAILSLSSLKHY